MVGVREEKLSLISIRAFFLGYSTATQCQGHAVQLHLAVKGVLLQGDSSLHHCCRGLLGFQIAGQSALGSFE